MFTCRTAMISARRRYPDRVKVGEELFFGGGRRFRVLYIVLSDEEGESPFVGLLQIEAA